MADEEMKPQEEKPEEKAEQKPQAEAQKPQAEEQAAKAPEKREGRPQRRGRRGSRPKPAEDARDEGIIERVVKISRVSKVVKGGKNFSFSAMVVTGDGNGNVGIGLGKSNEVVEAIKKGSNEAKKSMNKIALRGDTIPHEIIGKFKATTVVLKPAGPGTGVIAGGPVRAMCDAAGIKNILTKSYGSRNPVNVIKATVDGFGKLRLKRRG